MSALPYVDSNGVLNVPRTAGCGSPVVAADWAASAGWGTSPTIAVAAGSTDRDGAVIVTAKATPGANPTLTLTFADGGYARSPFATANAATDNGATGASDAGSALLVSCTKTTLVLQPVFTPTATHIYVFHYHVEG